jgi:hypothetical protein
LVLADTAATLGERRIAAARAAGLP